jgi:hypothetical protein
VNLDAQLTALDPATWTARLQEIADEHGYFEPLGAGHMAAFIDHGKSLLVSFESAEHARRFNPDSAPRGFGFVERLGWSSLTIVSEDESWFREPQIYGYFDRLTDDGFFEDFDQVVFYGAHAGGYAAAAYSVAAPGARVVAIRPQATLDPAYAGWDNRFRPARRTDFNSRYGFAPDMIEAADQAFVLLDPGPMMDAMHAALFRRPNVTRLACPRLGWRLDVALDQMQILAPVIEAAMAGSLSSLRFAQLWRARRENYSYLRGVLNQLDRSGHPLLAARLCRYAAARFDKPPFADRLAELQSEGYLSDAAQ